MSKKTKFPKPSKVQEAAVDAGLAAADIVPADGATLQTKVNLLVEHFGRMTDEDLADCDVCGAASSHTLSACPFCGVGEGGEAAASAEEPDQDEGTDDVEHDEPPPEEPEEDRNPGSGGEADAPPEPAQMPLAAAAETVVVEGQTLTKVKKTRGNKPAPLVKANGKATHVPAELVSGEGTTELDRRVVEIRTLMRGTAAGGYLLAKHVSEIAKAQLFKQRKSEDGKVKYRTMEDFAKAELGMTRKYVLELQKLFVRFNETEFIEYGTTKLRLVMQAPEGKQAHVLEKIKAGASRRQVESEDLDRPSAKPRKKHDVKGHERGGKTSTITVAAIEGKKTVKFYHREGKNPDMSRRAKRVGDSPIAYFDMANDVRLFITLDADADGYLLGKIDVRRVEE